jgi:FtsP/CotA-like multicopper oxidase with cupredoxin domain
VAAPERFLGDAPADGAAGPIDCELHCGSLSVDARYDSSNLTSEPSALHAAFSIALGLLFVPSGAAGAFRVMPPGHRLPKIHFHDNRTAAGHLSGGVLRVTLRARLGRWYPDGDRRPGPIVVAAFAAGAGPPTIPGPLIRVRAGTRIHLRVLNQLPGGVPLVMHGLRPRPAAGGDTLRVPSGRSREVEFDPGAPGTYYYWAATSDTTTLEGREGTDSQLNGALIVDPADGPVAPDRVFLLSVFFQPGDTTLARPGSDVFAVALNGRSWPLTERLDLAVGDTARWRWINPTVDNHPMHLHGFFYRVDAKGSETADTIFPPERTRLVVTERLNPGATMAMTWAPATPGHWLMHCHIHAHTAADPAAGLDVAPPRAHPAGGPGMTEMDDMAGLLLGIRVRPSPAALAAAAEATPRRRLRLAVGPSVLRPDGPHVRVSLTDPGGTVPDVGTPGPPIVLTRGEPAEVTVVNGLDEATAIHWHGIELESYYDGVAGWSGGPDRVAPTIAPGDSFVARMTPPRAGTFIYHAHNLATLQVGDGLVGPLIVLEPGETFDPSREIVWIIGGQDVDEAGFLRLNGTRWPERIAVESGRTYRVRIINITENNTGDLSLLEGETPVEWTPIAKDGATLAAGYRVPSPARVRTSVGETYDFEWTPGRPGMLRLEVRNGGRLMTERKVEVR